MEPVSSQFFTDKPYTHPLKIPPPMGRTTAFFYGTLMIPKILKNVISNDGSHLKLCPAILFVS